MTKYDEQRLENNQHANLELDLLLETVYRLSGFDFRQYNRASISRRVYNRMKINNIATISRLQEKVIHEEGYLTQLLNDFSINVTEMFRNPSFLGHCGQKLYRSCVIIQKSVYGMQAVPRVRKCSPWQFSWRRRDFSIRQLFMRLI